MIRFNVPAYTGDEDQYLQEVIQNRHYCGEGIMTQRCEKILEERFRTPKALLTTSCSAALDMTALLSQIKEGDEVIVPSYTFSTTASSYALRHATLVFVDIRPDTMNIDEKRIEDAITDKTKVLMVMHYAGVGCEMDSIMQIAKKHHLIVAEDAAQGVMSSYKGQALGTIGNYGCYSFHDTKNYNMGEGGALLVRDMKDFDRADNILDCGTDKKAFKAGKVSAYSWVETGSSYLPSELNAAFLLGQLENAEKINEDRLQSWNHYMRLLQPLEKEGILNLPFIPTECTHNAHMFYIKAKDQSERDALMRYLLSHEIQTASHYIPLHSAKAGKLHGRFSGEDIYTTKESARLTRLPMYYGLRFEEIETVVKAIYAFYRR